MTVPQFLSVRVDVWELRCRFNRGLYYSRFVANEFDSKVRSHDADPKYRLGPGGLSEEVYYRDRTTGVQVARVHQLRRADGTFGGGGKPDPKELWYGGIHYHLHSGANPTKQDPSLRFRKGIPRDTYLLWRRLKCKLIGR